MEQIDLMERIRRGEDSAFAELVHPLIEKGYRLSYSMLRSKEQAEEVVQNAMIEAYRNIINGKEITYFSTWFYKLITHRTIDLIRKNAKRKETILEVEVLSDDRGVMERIVKEETEKEIKQGITSLENKDYQNVLVLFYYQDLGIQEIAQLLDLKTSTVKSHLHRARNALKKRLLENQIVGVSSR